MAASQMEKYESIFIRKTMIAIAICLIKRKPPNLGIKEYCIAVQNKLKESDKPNLNDELSNNIYDIIISNPDIIDDSKCHIEKQQELMKFSTINSQQTVEEIQLKINFQIIHSIKCVKSFMSEYTNYFASQNISDTQNSNINMINAGNLKKSLESQSYKKGTNEQLHNEKKLSALNTSMLILLEFLTHTPEKFYNDNIMTYVSDITGKVVDLLYEKNLCISALNKILSLIDHNISKMIKEPNQTDKQKYFSILFLLNKSKTAMHHTINELLTNIEEFLNKLKSYGTDEIIELNEIDATDNLFYVFEALEEIYKMYRSHTAILSMSFKDVNVSGDSFNYLTNEKSQNEVFPSQSIKSNVNVIPIEQSKVVSETNVFEKMTEVLNRAVMECIDSYPLISFWAMEIINNSSTIEAA